MQKCTIREIDNKAPYKANYFKLKIETKEMMKLQLMTQ